MGDSYEFDFFVIGAGSGGVRAARIAAGLGARVAIAEDRYFGGTCVNVGCIPKKLFVYASHLPGEIADAAGFGWTVPAPSFDWPTLIANKDREISRLNGIYRGLLTNAGVTLIEGRASLDGPNAVRVGDKRYTAANILIATGGWPNRPSIPGIELSITSNEAFHLPALPKRMVIVGGGYIAVEFAGVFHGLGVETTLVHRGERFLRGFDSDIRSTLEDEMRKQGHDLRFGTRVTKIERQATGIVATLDSGEAIESDCVLYATGRIPNTASLGLESAGVTLGAGGEILVDAFSRTNVPSVWAVGDCTDRMNLTPIALAEGQAVARTLFGGEPSKPDYEYVPTAVFSHPPVGTVGLTEEQARERYSQVRVFRSSFRPLKHTISGRDERTMMKLIVDAATDRVVGCHMVGVDAGEILQGFAVALRCGATKAQFDQTIGIHPTAAEEFVTMRTPVA